MSEKAAFNPNKVTVAELVESIEQSPSLAPLYYEAIMYFLSKRLNAKKPKKKPAAKKNVEAEEDDEAIANKLVKLAIDKKLAFTLVQWKKLIKAVNKKFATRYEIPSFAISKQGEVEEDNENEDEGENKEGEDEDDEHEEESKKKGSRFMTKEVKNTGTLAQQANKYVLYAKAVQAPKNDILFIENLFRNHFQKKATVFREDFCSTAHLCCEWIKRDPLNNISVGVDIERECLDFALENHAKGVDQLLFFQDSVTSFQWSKVFSTESAIPSSLVHAPSSAATTTVPASNPTFDRLRNQKADIVCAYNYSVSLLHKKEDVFKYFKLVRESINEQGLFLLDVFGGYETDICPRKSRRDCGNFIYEFEQSSYDPISNILKCAIHFKMADGSWLRNAFTISFRKYTIRFLRELLEEAGFSQTKIWFSVVDPQNDEKGTGMDQKFKETTEIQQVANWTAIIVAIP